MSVDPGKSWRGVRKHFGQGLVLDTVAEATIQCHGGGRDGGKMAWLELPLCVIDCCAGDGIPWNESHTSSLLLIDNFANKLLAYYVPSDKIYVEYVEKTPATFNKLKQSVAALNPQYNHKVLMKDINQHEANFKNKQFTVFFIDPNKISDLASMVNFFDKLPDTKIMMITCGCNVRGKDGSIKGVPVKERLEWWDILWQLVFSCKANKYSNLPKSGADLVMVRLVGDAHQWFHLYRLPYKWSSNFAERLANQVCDDGGIEVVSVRENIANESTKFIDFMKIMCFKATEQKIIKDVPLDQIGKVLLDNEENN